MAGKNVLTVTEANFQAEVINSDIPVLIDFWAVWCGPCRMVAPIVEQLADEYVGRAKIGKLDVDNNRTLASTYGVSSIPTMMVFKGGKVVEQIMGARPKPALVQLLDRHL